MSDLLHPYEFDFVPEGGSSAESFALAHGFHYAKLESADFKDKASLMAGFEREFNLPAWWGKNWDAWWDLMNDLSLLTDDGYVLEIQLPFDGAFDEETMRSAAKFLSKLMAAYKVGDVPFYVVLTQNGGVAAKAVFLP